MRKPLNDTTRERLPHGSYTFVADAAFAASTSEADLRTGIVGAKVGDHLVVTIATAGNATLGLIYWGHVSADQTIEIVCTNTRPAAVNRPSTVINWLLLPQ